MFQRIVCATDFSPPADVATRYAASIARTSGATLELVHSWQLPPDFSYDPAVFRPTAIESLRDAARTRLDDAAKRAGPGTTQRMLDGPPDVAVVTYARSSGADLLVTGTHGRTALAHVLLGSVAERILRTSPVPVLVVPQDTLVGEALPFAPKRLLVPIDLSPASEHVLTKAIALAAELGARVDTVHAWTIPLYFAAQSELANDVEAAELRSYDELVRRVTIGKDVKVGQTLRLGEAPEVIRDVSRELQTDLVMMATAGRTGASHFLLGSVTERSLRMARLPTLVFRRPE